MEEIICKYDYTLRTLTPQGAVSSRRLDHYIQCWNCQPNHRQLPIDVKDDFEFRIVYHSCRDLYDGNIYEFGQNHDKSNHKEIQPTIHLTLFRIFEEDFSDDEKRNLKKEYTISHMVRRYKHIIDSNIWNYYVPIAINKKDDQFEFDYTVFNRAIEEIGHHSAQGHYKLDIACEYANLNARLACGSFIESKSKGHGNDISPFLFHSERYMKDLVEKKTKGCIDKSKSILDELKEYQWRFLLVDDYAWKSMDKTQRTDDLVVQKNSKLDILSDTISRMGFNVQSVIYSNGEAKKYKSVISPDNKGNDTVHIEIWGVESINEAFAAFEWTDENKNSQKYDIILLDYLLGEHSTEDSFGRANGYYESNREYGYQLLKRIKVGEDDEKRKIYNDIPIIEEGPVGQQFFMFISAFTTAVGERLRSEGLHRNEEKWYIAEGACPTNTPCLFQYYLARIMQRRLKQTSIDGLSYASIINQLSYIFTNDEEDSDKRITSVRQRAYDKYKDILGLHYDYFTLKKDESKSRLVESFMKDKVNMDAFLEHLLQFVHLVAFGTVRQWPEIWEEYKSVFRVFENVPEGERSAIENKIKDVSKSIEDYLITLKSA